MNPAPANEQQLQIGDYLRLFIARWRVVLGVFGLVFTTVAVRTALTTPVYEAAATVRIEQASAPNNFLGDLIRLSSPNPINAEMEIIRSRSLAERGVRELHLDRRVTRRSDGLEFRMERLSAARSSQHRDLEVRFTDDRGDFEVSEEGLGGLGRGKTDEMFHSPSLSFVLTEVRSRPGDTFHFRIEDTQAIVGEVLKGLTVAESSPQTGIIRIGYKDTDPERARDLVNRLAQAYIEQDTARKAQEATQTLEFLETQLDLIRENLEKAETQLDDFKSQEGVVDLSDAARRIVDKVTGFEKERAEIDLDKKNTESLYRALLDGRGDENRFLISKASLDDPLVGTLADELLKLEIERKGLLEEYTENHPAVQAVDAKRGAIRSKIMASMQNALSAFDRRTEALDRVIGRYDQDMRKLPQEERSLARLTRSSKVNEEIYTFLLKKHEEARIAKAAAVGSIQIIDPAVLPRKPIRPNVSASLGLGGVGGLLLGLVLALTLEFLDDSVKSLEVVEGRLGLPVYGVIPHIQSEGTNGSSRRERLIIEADARSIVAESYRSLRTNIQFAEVERTMQIILITSSASGEGKTTTAANLSITLAQAGHRTLLVDCDLRRPNLHKVFDQESEPGFTNLLVGTESVGRAVRPTKVDGLHLLPSGSPPPNPSELLASGKTKEVLDGFRKGYEFIVIDSPPILAVTDPALLGRVADVVFLVLSLRGTPLPAAGRAKNLLESIHARLRGAILNSVREASGLAYGYGYRYGGYNYYYSSYYHEAAPPTWVGRMARTARRRIKEATARFLTPSV